jgi:hypothetical protein
LLSLSKSPQVLGPWLWGFGRTSSKDLAPPSLLRSGSSCLASSELFATATGIADAAAAVYPPPAPAPPLPALALLLPAAAFSSLARI